MRIWSLHPQYLDVKGLVALWRETLLAKQVLMGKTKGYRNHPQLIRFSACKDPVKAIDQYLRTVFEEALERGYNFDEKKIGASSPKIKINVTSGQVEYECSHLAKKLKVRDKKRHSEFRKIKKVKLHPLFKSKKGGVEEWEIV